MFFGGNLSTIHIYKIRGVHNYPQHGGYRFNQPETTTDSVRILVKNGALYTTFTPYISYVFKHTTLVKKHVSTSLKTHLITCFGRW